MYSSKVSYVTLLIDGWFLGGQTTLFLRRFYVPSSNEKNKKIKK